MAITKVKAVTPTPAASFLAAALVILPTLFMPSDSSAQLSPAPANTGTLTFATIAEKDIPGRYQWTDAKGESYIVLYPDHTFMNKDGTRFGQYRWKLTANSLVITWSRGSSHFTRVERPGSYSLDEPGVHARMEKQPSPALQQAAEPPALTNDILASLTLGSSIASEGLTPVNLGGDGAIFPATVSGVACFELVRKENRPTGYLYLRIDPALKQEPVSNAFVIVDYFDPLPSAGDNGLLTVHFDGKGGAYDATQGLNFSGTQTWRQAVFYVATPRFAGRQNAGADFRLAARAPHLFIRAIKLVINRIPTEKYQFPLLLTGQPSAKEPSSAAGH